MSVHVRVFIENVFTFSLRHELFISFNSFANCGRGVISALCKRDAFIHHVNKSFSSKLAFFSANVFLSFWREDSTNTFPLIVQHISNYARNLNFK